MSTADKLAVTNGTESCLETEPCVHYLLRVERD